MNITHLQEREFDRSQFFGKETGIRHPGTKKMVHSSTSRFSFDPESGEKEVPLGQPHFLH